MTKLKVPSYVTILILTTITIVFWIIFSVYQVFTDKPEGKVSDETLENLSPTLDSETVTELESRIYFTEDAIPPTTLESTTPEPEPTSEAEPTEEPTPIATDSGSIEGSEL